MVEDDLVDMIQKIFMAHTTQLVRMKVVNYYLYHHVTTISATFQASNHVTPDKLLASDCFVIYTTK